MDVVLMVFPKIFCLEQMCHSGTRMCILPHNSGSTDCFTVLHNEGGQERHGNYINGFLERSLIQSNLVVWEQK